MEPDTTLKRKILEQKRLSLQAQGYEYSVNAIIARELGDARQAQLAEEQSDNAYKAARKVHLLLEALPQPSENGDG